MFYKQPSNLAFPLHKLGGLSEAVCEEVFTGCLGGLDEHDLFRGGILGHGFTDFPAFAHFTDYMLIDSCNALLVLPRSVSELFEVLFDRDMC